MIYVCLLKFSSFFLKHDFKNICEKQNLLNAEIKLLLTFHCFSHACTYVLNLILTLAIVVVFLSCYSRLGCRRGLRR